MKREDVEALLVAAQGAGPADPVFGEELFGVEAPTLAALCRRWLAVEDAEVAHVEPKNGLAVMHERCMPLAMIGQRVRIVPEDGQGVSDANG